MENSTVPEATPQKTQGNAVSVIIPWVLFSVLLIGAGMYMYITKMSKGASTASTQAKMCQGVNIVFFPGGNQKDPFASVVYNGAKAAETVLGAKVSYIWSDWDTDKMVAQFKDAIETSPDAIAIMGHPGADALSALVDEAERKNIDVTLQNVDIPSIREKYISNGFGYVGQNLYNSGLLVSNGVVRKYQPKEGTEAIVFGVDPKTDPSRYERTKGALDGLKNGKLVVHEITISPDVQKDTKSPAAQKMVADALNKYPNTKVIVIDHGALTASAPTILQNLGKKPGDFIIAGFDLSTDTVQGIKGGYIGLIQDQQPYLQGFLPILQSCLTKKYGFAGLYIDTGVGLIDNSNVDLVSSLAKQAIR
ncbi:MAG TPA: substrate-binding domain-containing protein [Patescibacteria group bacterium]|nr:substrate-binding domain-containing protein [Patescibacteria group bacterium]